MTDLEEWVNFLEKFELPVTMTQTKQDNTVISLEARDSDLVKGYAGFVFDITFDENKKFLDVGIWE